MTGKTNQLNNRISYIDMAKGIGIILVIALHTFGGMVLKFSLSFVMPMFFMLSALTCRYSSSANDFYKGAGKLAKRLLIIPLIIYLPKAIIRKQSVLSLLLTYIFERCETIQAGSLTIEAIGLLWFFSALFCARVIFDFLQLKFKGKLLFAFAILTSLAGVAMGHFGIWLPLNLDIGLAMQFFMYSAYIARDFSSKKATAVPKIAVAALAVTLLYCISFAVTCLITKDYLNIPLGVYPAFPLCLLTAVLGTAGTLLWCSLTQNISLIRKPLSFIGCYSVYAYCIHCLDNLYDKFWHAEGSLLLTFILRLACDIALTIFTVTIVRIIRSQSNKSDK